MPQSAPMCRALAAGHLPAPASAPVLWEELGQITSAQERDHVLSHSVKNDSTGYIWKAYILPYPHFKVLNFPFLSCCLLDIQMAVGEMPLLTSCRGRQWCHHSPQMCRTPKQLLKLEIDFWVSVLGKVNCTHQSSFAYQHGWCYVKRKKGDR